MDWISVGQRIRKQRESLRYTRETLAEKIDVTPKFCSDIELGVKGMSVPTLCRIAVTLNLSVDYILFGDGDADDDRAASAAIAMIKRCPKNKLPYLENIIKVYLQSFEE